jgi:hypothetical protein
MTYANFVPELTSKKLGKYLDNNTHMMKCVNRNYEGEIKNAGDSVKIVTPGNVTIRDYNGIIQTEKPSNTDTTLIVDQAKYFSFEATAIELAQSQSDLIPIYKERGGKALEIVRDTYLLSKVADADASNVISTSVVTKDNFYSKLSTARTLLGNNNALEGKKPFVIIDYVLEGLLNQAPEFIQANKLGEGTLTEGAIGRIAGFDILVSSNFTASSGTYNIMFGTDDAITYASQVVKSEMIDQNFKTVCQSLYTYGAKVILPKALGKLVVTLT